MPDALPPPGWYPDPNGMSRWWDGTQWGPLAPAPTFVGPNPSNTKTLAVISHLGSVFGGVLLPLIVYFTAKEDRYVKHHAAEALNFQITLMGVMVIAVGVFFGVAAIGAGTTSTGSGGAGVGAMVGGLVVFWVAAMVVSIGGLVLGIVGAVQASRGEWWRYPVSIRLVPGGAPKGTPPIWL